MAQYSVLVIGGCGFVGYHITRHFSLAPEFTSVTVISRSAADNTNKVDGVAYIFADLGNIESLQHVLDDIRPNIIIHAASPSSVTGTPRVYQKITVEGTRDLLKLAKNSASVHSFIYTSSSSMAKGREHLNLDETFPLANTDPKAPAYARTKAIAECLVLEANNPALSVGKDVLDWTGYLCTGAIRIPICYGTHDTMSLPGCFSALEKKQTNFQLGDGKNLWNFCSTENAGRAHVRLAKALLASGTNKLKIAGEAFHIHDGQSRLFWDYPRTAWKLAGYEKQGEHIISLPAWLLSPSAAVLEFLFWLFTFGEKRPQNLGKQQVDYSCYTHTYNIGKARDIVGYVPKHNFEEELAKAVDWSLKHDGWEKRLQRVGVFKS